MQETAQINPVVSRAHCDKVAAYLEEARQQKAELSGSAGPDAEGTIPPTLVVNPDAGLRLSREVFGPVVNGASGRWRGGAAPPTTAIWSTASVWTRDLTRP